MRIQVDTFPRERSKPAACRHTVEERLLHHILRKGGVADDAQRETVGDRPEPVVERAQRLLVTLGARGEQIVIVTV